MCLRLITLWCLNEFSLCCVCLWWSCGASAAIFLLSPSFPAGLVLGCFFVLGLESGLVHVLKKLGKVRFVSFWLYLAVRPLFLRFDALGLRLHWALSGFFCYLSWMTHSLAEHGTSGAKFSNTS